jgi:DNA-binding NarL/FixJ family response regulator
MAPRAADTAAMLSATPFRPRVLVAHHQPLLAMGLMAALQSAGGFELMKPPGPADVVISDQPGAAAAPVLVVSDQAREDDVRAAMAAGARGYLPPTCAVDELVQAVHSVARGLRYLPADTARRMADSALREPLTARETDVLRSLARGACNKGIAQQLGIGVGTVKAHVRVIFAKLDARSRTEAARIALERGLA